MKAGAAALDGRMRRMALAGLLCPVLFTAAWLVAGLRRRDYHPLRDDLSVLSAVGAPDAWIVSGGLVGSGLLTIAFAVGLRRWARASGRPSLGATVLLLAGAGIVALGLLPEDAPGPIPPVDRGSLTNQLHDATSVAVFLVLVAMPPLLARSLPATPAWRRLRQTALPTSLLTLVLVAVYLARLSAWSGLVQRLLASVPLLWMAALALRLLRERP